MALVVKIRKPKGVYTGRAQGVHMLQNGLAADVYQDRFVTPQPVYHSLQNPEFNPNWYILEG